MNYELLKLSKILPTINGRKTLDIYQERLDMARKAHQAQLEEQEAEQPQQKPTPKHYGVTRVTVDKGNRVYKEKRIGEVKSADRLPPSNLNGVLGGYSNLNVLLNEEEQFESLANMVGDNFKKKAMKSPSATQGNFFNKKAQNDVSTPTRPGTMSSNAPSNFVFRKKKIILRDTNELDHIYHYSLGTGFTVLTEDALGLNGRKVGVQELDQAVFIRQQKKYLKDMKLDPMTTYHSPYRDIDTLTQNLETQGFSSANITHKVHTANKIKDLKANAAPIQQVSKEDINPKMMKTMMIDGTNLKSFEKGTPHSSTPASPEKSVKGFF